MSRLIAWFLLPLALATDLAIAADDVARPLNWNAIGMFLVFVLFTFGVTRWAALRTRSASDFYTAGGGMTGFQNGLAIAGDMISAASFLGISAMMFLNGYDGLLYALGVLAGWPIILFLIAERLRNLGKYTFADVVSYRLEQTPVRLTSAFGTLTVALMYLVAQMVGAGKLIELLFGIDYLYAVMLVGVLMVFYVTFGGMLATTWVQIIKAVMLLFGTSFMAFMVLKHFGFSTEAMFAGAAAVHAKGSAIMAPGGLLSNPIDAISLGVGMMFGSMLIASIAVVFIGAEYATRQIHSTMTAVPRRSSIYISKLLVLSVWSFLVGVISAVAGYFVAQPILDPGISEQLSVGTPTVLNWLGVGLYCLLMSWMGLGFGAILRNNAGGIVMVVVLMFISTIVFGLLAETADWVADFQPYLPINLGETMTTVGLPEDANINNLEAGIWLGVWALVPALLGWFRFTFTDAKG